MFQGLYATWRGGVGLESLWNTLLFVNVCFCPEQSKTKQIEKYEKIGGCDGYDDDDDGDGDDGGDL